MSRPPIKKSKKPEVQEAYGKAQRYCAYQERCQQEVRTKLYSWELEPADVENIIVRLIEEDFLNEERFSKTYAGGKYRIKKWGRVKIRLALKNKGLSDYCIKKGLGEINDKDYILTLKKIFSQKQKKISGEPGKIKYALASYAISRGFESELVWDILNSLK
jgi:regulatory protein